MGAFFGGFLITAARESIYLAFATVLALMIFAYVGWLVVLLGADIAYYHQHPGKARIGRKPAKLSIIQQEQLTLAVAALVIHRFQNKLQPFNEEEIARQLGTNPMTTEQALQHLVDSGLLARTGDDPPKYLPPARLRIARSWRSGAACETRTLATCARIWICLSIDWPKTFFVNSTRWPPTSLRNSDL